jgi:uncharacterized protein YcfL
MKKLLMLLLVAATITSCSKKDSTPAYQIDQTSLSLNYDKEHQYLVKIGNTNADANSITWTSSDPVVGSISASGLFKAKRIGKTTVRAEIKGVVLSSEVIINPYSTLCKEPVLDFGASIAAVKSKENRALFSENGSALGYTGENVKLRNVLYLFDNTGLKSAMLLITDSETVMNEAATFISERYEFLGETEDEIYVFQDKNVLIGVSDHSDFGFNFLYLKNPAGTNAKASIQAVQKAYRGQAKPLDLKVPVRN